MNEWEYNSDNVKSIRYMKRIIYLFSFDSICQWWIKYDMKGYKMH